MTNLNTLNNATRMQQTENWAFYRPEWFIFV